MQPKPKSTAQLLALMLLLAPPLVSAQQPITEQAPPATPPPELLAPLDASLPALLAPLDASLSELLAPVAVPPPPPPTRLSIEITKGVAATAPIAVVPFGWQSAAVPEPTVDIARVIEANLERSGRFAALNRDNMATQPTTSRAVNFNDWRALKVDYMVVGSVQETANAQYLVRAQLLSVLNGQQLGDMRYTVATADLRRSAHQITDAIYAQLTGERSAFDTRIAYVSAATTANQPPYQLYVADADGYNARPILRSASPIMSPAWSPDGQQIAYVSFENRRSQVYIQQLLSGERERISDFDGINGAPAWSPDGRRLALTLSRQGSPDIYLYEINSRRFTQLTINTAIDTEPTWAPDASHILFTSDRGGRPQLYKIPLTGGTAQRVTYQGDYNARGVYSPDGKYIAMIHGRGSRYRIAMMETATGNIRVLTDGALDESPSFAPNGRILLYATAVGDRGVLSVASVDGSYQQRLTSSEGNIREPAWSPYNP